MPYHVVVPLPGGRVAVADYREPIAQAMHRIHSAQLEGKRPRAADYEAIAAWLDEHEEESARCRLGLLRGGPPCGHD